MYIGSICWSNALPPLYPQFTSSWQVQSHWHHKSVFALQMETETSLPIPPSNAGAPATASATAPATASATAPVTAPATAPVTAPAAAPAAAPSAEQPSTSQAAAEQPATSDQLAAAPVAEVAAPLQQAEPNTVAGEQAAPAADAAQQQQANNAAGSADPAANAMQDDNSPFTPGTVLRFNMDADDVTDSTALDFRAIRPIFGGKEGGVRHCDYQRVSDSIHPICKHHTIGGFLCK